MVDLAFGIFGTAMFAEPAVTNVEEVVGLVHKCEVPGARCRVSGVSQAKESKLAPDT